jgi:hypothetical protein
METVRYVYWQDDDTWLGHLEEFPDYMIRGRHRRNFRQT